MLSTDLQNKFAWGHEDQKECTDEFERLRSQLAVDS